MSDRFKTSGPIFDEIAEFFTGDEWGPEQVDGEPILRMEFQGDHGKWTCLAYAHDERERFVFVSILPIDVPEEKRAEASEYLTRANFGMEIGNFDMNYAEGVVQFRTSVDIEGGELSPKMIQNLAYINVMVTDQYLPGLVMVVEGDATPQEAVERVENTENAESAENSESAEE
jgi:hypothetical protein